MTITRPVSALVSSSPMPTVDALNPPAGSGLTPVAGDNVTDDRPAVQAALDYVKATHGGGRVVVSKPNAPGVRFLSGITIPAKVQLVSDETTVLNFSGIASNATAITVNDTNFTPMVGVRMDGGNFDPAATPNNATIGLAVYGYGLGFEKLHIQYFGRGVDVAHQDTFILQFSDCGISRCGTAFYGDIEAAGVGNAGERTVLDRCTIANSNVGFVATANGMDMHFTATSIDFCREFGRINNASVYFQGHLETGGGLATYPNYLFDLTGNGHLYLADTCVIMGGGRPNGLYYLCRLDRGVANYGYGGVRTKNTSIYWVDQTGAARNTFSEHMIALEANQTSVTLRNPFPLRWTPVTVAWCVTDGAVVPNNDVIRISAMDAAAGTVTLTASAAHTAQRWMRVSFG